MAAFSSISQQHPFILDSPLFFPNHPLSVFDHSSTATAIDSSSALTNHNHNHDDNTPNINRKRKSKEERKVQKQRKMTSEEKKAEFPGYIHVRARRGQATDSHSLAERVRREKISERMKVLQAIVPGCEKISGKAMVLDEIINYVQFLQNQVEFLSMKLASVNPMFSGFGMDMESFLVSPEDQTGKQELWEMEVDEFRQNINNNKTSGIQQDINLFGFH